MNSEVHLNEPFGRAIYQTIIQYDLKKNLEIGSWDGEGSTACFVKAMETLMGDKRLDCIEIIDEKFSILKERYKGIDFVHPFHGTSISYEDLVYKNFEDIWKSPYNKISSIYSKDLVESWFKRDVEGMKNSTPFLPNSSILYDSVLIDGSEFTGYSEFILIKDKCRVLFLDDVHNAFKCYQIYYELIGDDRWELLESNPGVRNGYAIFKLK